MLKLLLLPSLTMALKLCNETSEFISICSLKPGYNSEDTMDAELEAEGTLLDEAGT